MIKNENFYIVQGWMQNELKLRGNELRVYAIIYGFSQNGTSEFKCDIGYLSEFLDISYKTVCRTLTSLTDKGYLKKNVYNKTNGGANGYSCVPLEDIKAAQEEARQADVKDFLTDILGRLAEEFAQEEACEAEEQALLQNNLEEVDFTLDTDNVPQYIVSSEDKTQDVVGRTNCPTGWDKMTEGVGQNVPPHIDSNNIYSLTEQQSKEVISNKKVSKNINKFLSNKQNGEKKKLPSYQEIMDDFGVSKFLQRTIWEFIRHCQLNGRMMTNEKLENVLIELDFACATDEERIGVVKKAINRGYFDIKRHLFGGQD